MEGTPPRCGVAPADYCHEVEKRGFVENMVNTCSLEKVYQKGSRHGRRTKQLKNVLQKKEARSYKVT